MRNRPSDTAFPLVPGLVPAGWLRKQVDHFVLGRMRALLDGHIVGRLHVTMPSGASAFIGGKRAGGEASLVFKSYDVFWQSLRRGTIGFAESYMAGAVETSDLVALFRFFLDNKGALKSAGGGHFRVRAADRMFHGARANTRDGAKRNIAAHYDLGNAFYGCWLDASMTYSSALYTRPDMTLEAAQQAKIGLILDALELAPGHKLLEIGCGWGAFAAAAIGRGAFVTGLTLSNAQRVAAQARLDGNGLGAQADIRIEDYRDAQGTFERIASIEMIEAVGEENWPGYFAAMHDRLAPGGVAVIQAIVIDPAIYSGYRAKADFIQRYIFPGGMLPTEQHISEHAAAAGLAYERVATFGASYALTLAEWRQRFDTHWPVIEAMGFDARFRRMWTYYLTYCQAGFERGSIDVGVYRLRKQPATSQLKSGQE